jgi:hypothetical protein
LLNQSIPDLQIENQWFVDEQVLPCSQDGLCHLDLAIARQPDPDGFYGWIIKKGDVVGVPPLNLKSICHPLKPIRIAVGHCYNINSPDPSEGR